MDVLVPNLVCIAGPPCIGKTTVAQSLRKHMSYGYINFGQFCHHRGLTTCEQKAKGLMSFLDRVACRNFILDGFPETQKQAKIVFETFGAPLKLFYVEAEKDEVHNRIYAHSQSAGQSSVDSMKAHFDEFLHQKDKLYSWLQSRPFFQSVNGRLNQEEMFITCRDAISPVVHFCNKSENKELFNHYIRKLEKKGFVYINLQKVIEAEISRGLPFSEELKQNQSTENIFALLRKIFYSEPLQNTKYIISNFPNDLQFLRRFPKEVCNFALMLHLTKNEGGLPEQQQENYSEEWLDIIGNYHASNQLVGIGINDPGIVDFHSEKRNRYGIIVGPTGTGKSAISKALDKADVLKVVYFKRFNEECIKRLTKDDVAPDEVPLPQVFGELNKDLSIAPADQLTLIDGFNLNDGNLDSLIQICGEPLFVLQLDADKDLVTQRYQAKTGTTELSEEDQETINKYVNSFSEITNKVNEMSKENSNLSIFDIDVSLPLTSTLDAVKSIFRKRLFLTRITSSSGDQEKLKHTVAWLCARYGYLFVDMESVLKEAKQNSSYDSMDPAAILKALQYRVNSSKKLERNVMLFNYLQADQVPEAESHFYPKSKDEVYFLEQNIGSIRACFNFCETPEKLDVDQILIPKVDKPVVIYIKLGSTEERRR